MSNAVSWKVFENKISGKTYILKVFHIFIQKNYYYYKALDNIFRAFYYGVMEYNFNLILKQMVSKMVKKIKVQISKIKYEITWYLWQICDFI